LSAKKRVLLTGAGGFIGRSSLLPLRAAGYEVHGVLSPHAEPTPMPGMRVHRADLLEPAAIDALLATVRPTHLLHFAWIATPGVYSTSKDNYRWLAASQHLARSFQMCGGMRAVMAGSCAEYDWSQVKVCHERTTPLAGGSGAAVAPYVECKIALQQTLVELGRAQGLSAAWGRLFYQFGPHEHPKRLVASVIINLLSGREVPCTHGQQVRSFLHVADVGAAFVALLDSTIEGPVNIGSDESISIAKMLEWVAQQIGRPELLKLGALKAPPNEPPILVPNVARLRDEIGWTPKLKLGEGLIDAIDWWRRNLTEGAETVRRP